jgi:hypothetical protein
MTTTADGPPQQPNDPLEQELGQRRSEIATESYSISIGELTNLFRDGELNVRPEFQRIYRWDDEQKSSLIESILLGIPLPSIFVAQDESGKWDLVDGLQRVSTLLELQGHLPKPEGGEHPPLVLQQTKFLPSLEGRLWDAEDADRSLSQAQRLDIKRAKIDVKIIKRASADYAKYELFQRLNSYGSQLTPQELRSCLIVSINPEVLDWVERLSTSDDFEATISLPERLVDEQYHLELVLRFLVLHNLASVNQQEFRSIHQYLDDAAIRLASDTSEAERAALTDVFDGTFQILAASGGDELLRRWNPTKGQFQGSFLSTSFEVIAMGVGYCVANGIEVRPDLREAAQELWVEHFATGQSSGKSAERRIAENLPLGRELVRLD